MVGHFLCAVQLQTHIMKAILCSFCVLFCLQVRAHSVDLSSFPDSTNIGCLSNDETAHILEYNKVEIINNLQKYPLSDLFSQRGIMPDDNPKFNRFLHCIWKKEHYLTGNDDINYEKLERIIKDAIVGVVGRTGPAINLSMVHAMRIMNDCKTIKESNTESRIAKIQNHIVNKLQPFAKI